MIPALDVHDFELLWRGVPFQMGFKKILSLAPIPHSCNFLIIFSDFSTLAVHRYAYIPLGVLE